MDMKEIKLTRNQVTIVDDIDYDYLMQWKWVALTGNRNEGKFYAARITHPNGKSKAIMMHRVIAKRIRLSLEHLIDHIDRNRLNNQRNNLREATVTQSAQNCVKNNKTGFRGVVEKPNGKWVSQIRANNKSFYLGTFDSPVLAAIIYNRKAKELHGDFAILNLIPNPRPHE
jgi:hypothetical protein